VSPLAPTPAPPTVSLATSPENRMNARLAALFLLLVPSLVLSACTVRGSSDDDDDDLPGVGDDDDSIPPLDDDDSAGDDDDAADDDDAVGDDDDAADDDDDDDDDAAGDDDDAADDDDATPPLPCTDDANEDHDDQANALALSPGLLAAQTVCDGDEDWYSIAVPAGQMLTIDLTFLDEEGDIDLEILDANGDLLDDSVSGSDDESAATEAVEVATDVFVRVWLYGDGGQFGGNEYDIEATVDVPPTCAVDAFEPNQTLADAEPLTAGSQAGLSVCEADEDDWFAIDLVTGQELTVDLGFVDDEGDIDLKLFDAAETQLQLSTSTDDNESITHTATFDGAHYVRVYLYADAGSVWGNTYDLTATVP
jgi:hypothetical protein